jgi:hypothetical protein
MFVDTKKLAKWTTVRKSNRRPPAGALSHEPAEVFPPPTPLHSSARARSLFRPTRIERPALSPPFHHLGAFPLRAPGVGSDADGRGAATARRAASPQSGARGPQSGETSASPAFSLFPLRSAGRPSACPPRQRGERKRGRCSPPPGPRPFPASLPSARADGPSLSARAPPRRRRAAALPPAAAPRVSACALARLPPLLHSLRVCA